ncbi:MAG: helix-turn-helix transcriptional regulator [Bacillota bacterium]|nr:helix-turn-helix transcriptional regulator [Bacillota bacterium]
MTEVARTRLKDLRRKAGLTQHEVAKMLGIGRSFYGMIETGARNPTLDLARRIADLFGVGIEQVFFASDCHELRQDEQTATLESA